MNASSISVGLIGEGIGQSLSPSLHVAEATRQGLSLSYELFDRIEQPVDAAGLHQLLSVLRSRGYSGVNLTHPYKQLVLPLLDKFSPAAAIIRAVNHVQFSPDGTIGHNTDWTGFRWGIESGLVGANLGSVLQVGAGGAGAATAYALLDLGVSRLVISDTLYPRAAALAERYAIRFPDATVESVELEAMGGRLSEFDGLVHATPVGMAQHPGVSVEVDRLRADAWLAEVVYRPIETELVARARSRGHRVLDGGLMAIGQAVDSLRLFSGIEPDPLRMRAHFDHLLAEEAAGTAVA